MWLTAFCATLALAGFGCESKPAAPSAPITVHAEVHGRGQAGVLVVEVVTQADGPHALVELSLPEGVSAGKTTAEADLEAGKGKFFRFPIRAAKPGAYVIGVKAMAGATEFRFGRSISVAWVALAN
jgi:hypothetical protein